MGEKVYDALLYISFGGPEKQEDVIPFLRNVTGGRNIPEARLFKAAAKYRQFKGKSPINDSNRKIIRALESALTSAGLDLPVYWGNRFWSPSIEEALQKMKNKGVKKAIAFVTSPYSSDYGCRQYRDLIEKSLDSLGSGITIHKLRPFSSHPLFIKALSGILSGYLKKAPDRVRRIVFTAHNIPAEMARSSKYIQELEETSRLVMDQVIKGIPHTLAFQSRNSGYDREWLSPELDDVIRETSDQSCKEMIILPIGFLSDHMEVVYDLDIEAAQKCRKNGLIYTRLQTVGETSDYILMIRRLIEEQMNSQASAGRPLQEGLFCPGCPDPCDF